MAYSRRVLELLHRVHGAPVEVDVDDATAVRTARQAERLGLVTVESVRAATQSDTRPSRMVVTGLTRLGQYAIRGMPPIE